MGCSLAGITFPVNLEGQSAIAKAGLVLLMISGELVSPGYLNTRQFDQLLERHRARCSQLLPVVLRPVAWSSLHPGLVRIPPLPGHDRSVVEASNREASFVEVVEGVRLVCRDIAAARAQPSRPQQRPVRARHRLVDVFKDSGVPSVTFVEPDGALQACGGAGRNPGDQTVP
jgi:hypothetical protein